MEALAVGLGFLSIALTVCWLVAISEVIRLRKLSAARERQISKFDHDHDGRIGGSVGVMQNPNLNSQFRHKEP